MNERKNEDKAPLPKMAGARLHSESAPSGLTPLIVAVLPHARRVLYPAKKTVVRVGEESGEIYFILSGSVRVLVEDEEGHELILAYLGPGEFFGELGLFGGETRRSASVRTRTTTEVAIVSYRTFLALCRNDIDLLMHLAGQIATRLRATSQRMGHLAFLDVTGRIARALLELARDSQVVTHPDGALIKITREELGLLVNCTREMAGRVLHDLERQGLIEIHGQSIVVPGAHS